MNANENDKKPNGRSLDDELEAFNRGEGYCEQRWSDSSLQPSIHKTSWSNSSGYSGKKLQRFDASSNKRSGDEKFGTSDERDDSVLCDAEDLSICEWSHRGGFGACNESATRRIEGLGTICPDDSSQSISVGTILPEDGQTFKSYGKENFSSIRDASRSDNFFYSVFVAPLVSLFN